MAVLLIHMGKVMNEKYIPTCNTLPKMKIQAQQQMCTGLTSFILLLGEKLINATSTLGKHYQNATYSSTLLYLHQQSFALYWHIEANLCQSSFTHHVC